MNIIYVAPDIPVPHTSDFIWRFDACLESSGELSEERKQGFHTIKKSDKRAEEI